MVMPSVAYFLGHEPSTKPLPLRPRRPPPGRAAFPAVDPRSVRDVGNRRFRAGGRARRRLRVLARARSARPCDARVILPGYPRRFAKALDATSSRICPAPAQIPPCSIGRLQTSRDGLVVYLVLCAELYDRDGSPYGGRARRRVRRQRPAIRAPEPRGRRTRRARRRRIGAPRCCISTIGRPRSRPAI